MSVLRADNLAKRYKSRQVVTDASLQVESGEVVGLLGPNGAGKTTCFYMMVGLIRAQAGKIRLDDIDLTALPVYKRARLGLSYLPSCAATTRLKLRRVWKTCWKICTSRIYAKRPLPGFPVANDDAWKLPAHLQPRRVLFCWTNPLPVSTRFPSLIFRK